MIILKRIREAEETFLTDKEFAEANPRVMALLEKLQNHIIVAQPNGAVTVQRWAVYRDQKMVASLIDKNGVKDLYEDLTKWDMGVVFGEDEEDEIPHEHKLSVTEDTYTLTPWHLMKLYSMYGV